MTGRIGGRYVICTILTLLLILVYHSEVAGIAGRIPALVRSFIGGNKKGQ